MRVGSFLTGGDAAEGEWFPDWGSGIGTLSVYVGDLDVSRIGLTSRCARQQ